MLYYLQDRLGFGRKVSFTRSELNLLLGLYGARVQQGRWRDYAIDALQDMAVFSVYRHSHERPLFSIVKIKNRNILKPASFVVYEGPITDNRVLTRGATMAEALECLRDEKE